MKRLREEVLLRQVIKESLNSQPSDPSSVHEGWTTEVNSPSGKTYYVSTKLCDVGAVYNDKGDPGTRLYCWETLVFPSKQAKAPTGLLDRVRSWFKKDNPMERRFGIEVTGNRVTVTDVYPKEKEGYKPLAWYETEQGHAVTAKAKENHDKYVGRAEVGDFEELKPVV